MNEVVVINPDTLRDLVANAVARGVREALAQQVKNASSEMADAEAAEYLGISAQTLRAWRVQKRGPAYHKSGRAVRYAKTDLDAWLNSNRVLTIDSLEARHDTSCL